MSIDNIQIEKKLLNQHTRAIACKDSYVVLKTFTNSLAKQGKLSKAKQILSQISHQVKLIKEISIYLFVYRAVINVRPLIGIKNQGGSLVAKQAGPRPNQKPQMVPLPLARGNQLAIRWLLEGAKKRSALGRTMSTSLFYELNDAYNNKGYALKKKYEWHARLLSSQMKSYSFASGRPSRLVQANKKPKPTSSRPIASIPLRTRVTS